MAAVDVQAQPAPLSTGAQTGGPSSSSKQSSSRRVASGTGLLRAHLGALVTSTFSEQKQEDTADERQMSASEARGTRAAIFLQMLDLAQRRGAAAASLEARLDRAVEAMVAEAAKAENARRAAEAASPEPDPEQPAEPWEDCAAAALEERLQKALLAACLQRAKAAEAPRQKDMPKEEGPAVPEGHAEAVAEDQSEAEAGSPTADKDRPLRAPRLSHCGGA